MEEQEQNSAEAYFSEFGTRIMDIEEKQRILKERLLLIGKNLIESKETMSKELAELKVKYEELNMNSLKMRETILRVLSQLENLAKTSDLELVAKQVRMLNPIGIKNKKE